MAAPSTVRMYIGGLPPDITTQELYDRFGRFVSTASDCHVAHVDVLPHKNPRSSSHGITCRGVAYLTLLGTDAVAQSKALAQTFDRTKWRGAGLRVQEARLDWRQKLAHEWAEQTQAASAWDHTRQAQEEKLRLLSSKMPDKAMKPLKLTVPFQGRKTTVFDDVDDATAKSVRIEADTETVSDRASGGGSGSKLLAQDDVEAGRVQWCNDEAAGVMEHETKPLPKQLTREEMNARRLAALDAKQKQRKSETAVISVALGAATRNKKITFDDSGNEQETEKLAQEQEQAQEQVTVHWMDSSDDEASAERGQLKAGTLEFLNGHDDADADAQAAFAVRPEFVGETGRKLFEMQKRFGGDSRFRLDARFLDEEANEYGGNDVEGDDDQRGEEQTVAVLQNFLDDDEDVEVTARHAREMREEQEAALRVMSKLYPDVDVTRLRRRMQDQRVPKDPLKQAAWMGELKRYDPRDAHTCREFEIPITVATSGSQEVTLAPKRSKELPTGGDRFFSTAGDLSNLFSRVRKNSEDGEEGEAALDGVFRHGTAGYEGDTPFQLSSLFSFSAGTAKPLAAMGEQLLEEDEQEEIAPNAVDSTFSQGFHPIDSYHEDDVVVTDSEAGDDTEDMEQTMAAAPAKKKSLEDFLAFGRTFVGGDEIGDWQERRKKLTLDYKRKRRDAVKLKKRQNKQPQQSKTTKSKAGNTETATPSKKKKVVG